MKKMNVVVAILLMVFVIPVLAEQVSLMDAQKVAETLIERWNAIPGNAKHHCEFSFADIEPIFYEGQKVGFVVHLQPKGFMILSSSIALSPLRFITDNSTYENCKNHPFLIGLIKRMHEIKVYLENRDQHQDLSLHQPDNRIINSKILLNKKTWSTLLSGNTTSIMSSDIIEEQLPLIIHDPTDEEWDMDDINPFLPNPNNKIGCVAIAAGQIMNYHKFPKRGTGYVEYYWQRGGTYLCANFNGPLDTDCANCIYPESYDWNQIKLGWSAPDRNILLRDIGYSVKMDYGNDKSGAFITDFAAAMISNFKFHKDIRIIERVDYNDDLWFQTIKQQRDKNHLVYYSLFNWEHATIIDGYRVFSDGSRLVHINMGGVIDSVNQLKTGWYTIDMISGTVGDNGDIAVINIRPGWITINDINDINGDEYTITWNSTVKGDYVRLELYNDGKLGNIIDKTENDGSYNWAVGTYNNGSAVAPGGDGYTIKIRLWNPNPYYDEVDIVSTSNPFTIPEFTEPPSLTVISPNGGENWFIGSTYPITWQSNNLPGDVKIMLYQGTTHLCNIKNDTPNTGIYNWTIDTAINSGTNYKVKVRALPIELDVDDASDAGFSISETPTITVTSPNGGENWQQNSTKSITWNATGISNGFRIDLFKDDAPVGMVVTNIDSALRSFNWTVGRLSDGSYSPVGSGYKIKVKEVGNPLGDKSNASFSITSSLKTYVSINLGTSNWVNDLYLVEPSNGNTTPVTLEGINSRRTKENGDYYFYFDVRNFIDTSKIAIKVVYYDNTNTLLRLDYCDTSGNPWAVAGYKQRTNTNTWKTWIVDISDAGLNGLQYMNADFRVGSNYSGYDFVAIDIVTVQAK
jgi:hypothetical protein